MCTICLEHFERGSIVSQLSCGPPHARHVFHAECLTAAAAQPGASCPVCRQGIQVEHEFIWQAAAPEQTAAAPRPPTAAEEALRNHLSYHARLREARAHRLVAVLSLFAGLGTELLALTEWLGARALAAWPPCRRGLR